MRYLYELGHSYTDPTVRKRLSHYYAVLTSKKPSKYRIVRRIWVDFEEDMSLKELWKLHDEAEGNFAELSEVDYSWIETHSIEEKNLLDLKAVIAKKMLESCIFCERRCNLNRYAKRGACRLDFRSHVSSFFHHFGEEPPLVGGTGSGTIFFTGCNFRCVFCQNYDISQDPYNGIDVDDRTLSGMMKVLNNDRCLNVNLVGGEPTPNLHTILEALGRLDENIPILWNSNMYMSEETMKLILDVIDIWLPDFKYGNDECARRLSGVNNYFKIVTRNLLLTKEDDIIIRHLVLPNHLECCTYPILEWLARNLKDKLVNIMGQYRPEHIVARLPHTFPDIARRPYLSEMERAMSYAKSLGLVYEPVS